MSTGSLTIVGTGIQLAGHLTLAAKAWIEQADKVLFAVADPITAQYLQTLNATAQPLFSNTSHQQRKVMHQEMVKRILSEVRQGFNVCVVFYGHPGVFVDPAHIAIKKARKEGFKAQMLPGISAQACLFADLGLDPGKNGCQSFEVTDFLIRRRRFDPTSALILWQIGVIGNLGFYQENSQQHALNVLVDVLEPYYSFEHEVIVYEASIYPISKPVIQKLPLFKLLDASITEVSTLYVPPKAIAPLDTEMMTRLGISMEKM